MATKQNEKGSLEEMMAKVEGIIEEIRSHLQELRRDFRLLLGIQVTMGITLIVAILFTR